jgi:hypothetical protein
VGDGGALQQIDALVTRIACQIIDLVEHFRVLTVQGVDFRCGRRGECALGQGFGRGDQGGNGLNTFVGRAHQLNRFRHFVFTRGQVLGALAMAQGRKVVHGIVDGRLDTLAGGQSLLGSLQQRLRILQTEEVFSHA